MNPGSETGGRVRVAAVQMISGPQVGENLREAEHWIAQAAREGARLIALPEYFALMGLRDTDKLSAIEPAGDGPIQAFLSRLAARHGVWIAGCSVPLPAEAPDKMRNSLLVFDAQGRCAARYDKIHLFGFERAQERFDESRTIEPGAVVVALDTPFGRLGLSICYDLRFPEIYRAMREPDLILVPSAFTATTGRAHWEILLRARAVENLAYVIAPAQGGVHQSGRETYGHSMIVDPWGEVLGCLERGPGVVMGEIDRDHLARIRHSLPALRHRRFDATNLANEHQPRRADSAAVTEVSRS